MTDPVAAASWITEYLRANAGSYFSDLAGKNVAVDIDGGGRVLSTVYRFRLRSDDIEHSVIVKMRGPRETAPRDNRPRLKPIFDQNLKFKFEHAALSAIDEYFSSLRDPRFGTIRTFEFIEEHDAIIMERATQPSLKLLMARTNRIQKLLSRNDVLEATENSGAWLRAFHSAPPFPGSRVRHDSRRHFIDVVNDFTQYLSAHRSYGDFFERVRKSIDEAAVRHLPGTLPTAMGHGDFAPRNILVGPGATVTVYDTLGTWRPPIYEDIGFFVGGLYTTRIQAVTRGAVFSRRDLERQERSFLEGYFGHDAIPTQTVALFAIQGLLDKWSAYVQEEAASLKSKGRSIRARLVSSALDAQLRREIDRFLARVE